MKFFKFLIAFSLLFVHISNTFADESHLCEEGFGEFVISADHLIIKTEGIFVDLGEDDLYLVENLIFVEPGIYKVRGWFPEDCKHTVYCPNCGGCAPYNRCPGRCKCPPLW